MGVSGASSLAKESVRTRTRRAHLCVAAAAAAATPSDFASDQLERLMLATYVAVAGCNDDDDDDDGDFGDYYCSSPLQLARATGEVVKLN